MASTLKPPITLLDPKPLYVTYTNKTYSSVSAYFNVFPDPSTWNWALTRGIIDGANFTLIDTNRNLGGIVKLAPGNTKILPVKSNIGSSNVTIDTKLLINIQQLNFNTCQVDSAATNKDLSIIGNNICFGANFTPMSNVNLYFRLMKSFDSAVPIINPPNTIELKGTDIKYWFHDTSIILSAMRRNEDTKLYLTADPTDKPVGDFAVDTPTMTLTVPFRVRYRTTQNDKAWFNLYPASGFLTNGALLAHVANGESSFMYSDNKLSVDDPRALFTFVKVGDSYYIQAGAGKGNAFIVLQADNKTIQATGNNPPQNANERKYYLSVNVVEGNAFNARLRNLFSDNSSVKNNAQAECCLSVIPGPDQPLNENTLGAAACKLADVLPNGNLCQSTGGPVYEYCGAVQREGNPRIVKDIACQEYFGNKKSGTDVFFQQICDRYSAEEKLNEAPNPLDPSALSIGNLCGCFMGQQFFNRFAEGLTANLKVPETGIYSYYELFYPPCASAPSRLQTERTKNNLLPKVDIKSCIQKVTVDINGDVKADSIVVNPSARCNVLSPDGGDKSTGLPLWTIILIIVGALLGLGLLIYFTS